MEINKKVLKHKNQGENIKPYIFNYSSFHKISLCFPISYEEEKNKNISKYVNMHANTSF